MNSKSEFRQLCRRLGAKRNPDPVFDEISEYYSSADRSYHTIAHIEFCLQKLSETKTIAKEPDSIALALWFHDVIYDSHRKDNEEQSALFWSRKTGELQLSPGLQEKVASLILMTKHDRPAQQVDEKLIVDIDLAVLGTIESEYDDYEQKIRLEYEWVSLAQYRQGRTKVLRQFLERPFIYNLPYFRQKFEEQARKNLMRAINSL